MSGPRVLATVVVAFACALFPCGATSATLDLTPSSAEALLARVKAVFRAHPRPPYVVYTLVRRDQHDGTPDFENSYSLKLWCRTSDRSALTRRLWNGKPYGGMDNITVAFDDVVDPGPPTADIFERALFAPSSPTPEPSPLSLPTIGGTSVSKDFDYRVARANRDGDLFHLELEPKRDAARNRIDALWIDAATFEIRRMRSRDHLYLGLTGQSIEDEYDARFTQRDGLPMLATIHGQTAWGAFETDYTYTDVSFPATLPAWYFDPKTYGAHRADAPA
ncbi:MAG: hypothetical protein ABI186_05125 [Candidatus Elarobacter sp.]